MTFKFVVINRGSTIQATFIMEKNSIIDIYYTKKWYNKNGILILLSYHFFGKKTRNYLSFCFSRFYYTIFCHYYYYRNHLQVLFCSTIQTLYLVIDHLNNFARKSSVSKFKGKYQLISNQFIGNQFIASLFIGNQLIGDYAISFICNQLLGNQIIWAIDIILWGCQLNGSNTGFLSSLQ